MVAFDGLHFIQEAFLALYILIVFTFNEMGNT